jgi:Leucine-rich repeat (LRR) protein
MVEWKLSNPIITILKLTGLSGLDLNVRIKHIYLQDNKIRTLKGSLEKMRHLESLVIYNNELRDLDLNLDALSEYPYLQELGIVSFIIIL